MSVYSDKTVYLVDKLTADNRVFHKACFGCHHCRGTLKLSNYNSFEGVLYCRPHFISSSKELAVWIRVLKNALKVLNLFEGTRKKCKGCSKTAYPIERVTVNGTIYHKSCFKCTHGGCTISPSNYVAHEGKLYCKHHHIQLFKVKGNYSQLETTDREEQQNATADKVASIEVATES